MSELVFIYTIRYVSKDDVIDPDNYNSLVNAVFALAELFLAHFEQMVEALGDPGLHSSYITYINTMSKFQERREQGMYLAEFMAPVYTYHHLDLKEVLLATAIALHNLTIYMERAGMEVPGEVKRELNYVILKLMQYPKLKTGDVVQPEDHNDLLDALKRLHDIISLMGFTCGKYDITKYGLCTYC